MLVAVCLLTLMIVSSNDSIIIRGASEHNLKHVNLTLPRNRLIVLTGLSGSGKSSLAFDTLYAEGQRRYVESLSAYARQFLDRLEKPEVESIEGLSPAIAIEQRNAGSNPRSTVGTQTEIYDYLRVLFARVGKPFCPKCNVPIQKQTSQEIVERLLELAAGSSLTILAPIVRGRKGEYLEVFRDIKRQGFVRARVDGTIYDLDDRIKLDKKRAHTIEVVVDRLVIDSSVRGRLTESVETALKVGKGIIVVHISRQRRPAIAPPRHGGVGGMVVPRPAGGRDVAPIGASSQVPQACSVGLHSSASDEQTSRRAEELVFSELYACVTCGFSFEEISPRIFSFNSPYGACPTCDGLSTRLEVDPDLIVPDTAKSLQEGAIEPWKRGGMHMAMYYSRLLREFARHFQISLETPFKNLPRAVQQALLSGCSDEVWGEPFEGVIPNLERRFRQTESDYVKQEISRYMSVLACPDCQGLRLKPASLSIRIDSHSIAAVTSKSVEAALAWLGQLSWKPDEQLVAEPLIKEIGKRLQFLIDVGLGYLTLSRTSSTLSGGEAQRIRLATQVGSGLVGVLYILDEPSIGLHPRDNEKLLKTLIRLRDLGNTLVVVEHDEATIRNADYIVDLGLGAGKHGGEVIASGTLDEILKSERSLTAQFLTGKRRIPLPLKRRPSKARAALLIQGASEHNLRSINVRIPLGCFVCVTGVSGSGKSTLVDEILFRALARRFYGSKEHPGKHERILGMEHLDKVIVIDQSPIGRTPRSNPATYTGVFDPIRQLFSQTANAKMRGFAPGRFSFNVKGGRCEACQGDGIRRIEMHFLPDVYVRCEVCKGKRFNEQTLQVNYKGKSIADILAMTVEEALELFRAIPSIAQKLSTVQAVGLDYLELGQSATTLSGGEAQRIKLAKELSKRATGRTLYLLDEPTTGLHFADVDKLLRVLHQLVDQGNTVVVIEHNLEVVKTADFIIDLGPEGGDHGGRVVAQGSPEAVAVNLQSWTGRFLKPLLEGPREILAAMARQS
ncbi:MAG: excinuclease ABC subunit UvrA [Candidatus Omnitrophica bacterium]|nr:excinuclease ABC subunit UvrA [Candidatus Omnitrophota bacterium]